MSQPTQGSPVQAAAEKKACPIASIATLQSSGSPSVLVGGAAKPGGQTWAMCIGEKCMWAVPLMNSEGKVLALNCAITLAPSALMGIQQTILGVAQAAMQQPEEPETSKVQ